jgi:hypothetical protein
MAIKVPFILKTGEDGKPTTITLYLDGKPQIINSSAPLFDGVFNALKNGDEAGLRRCLEVKKSLSETPDGKFKLFEDSLYYDGVQLGPKMFARISAVFKTGVDITPIVNFLGNLHSNPSQASRDELYLFLEHNNLPITDDGHFLAYKMIRDDYTDCHSGTMDNSVGKIVEMPRGDVNANRHETCSRGLHFCSRGYIGEMGASARRLVVLKINPADVVSIPSDYNNAKGRACKYLIMEEIKFKDHLPDNYVPSATSYNPDEEDDGMEEEQSCDNCGEHVDECTCEDADEGEQESQNDTVHVDKGDLTDDDVRNIRKAVKNGNLSLTAIGKTFNRHRSQIQRIRDGQAYAHVK